MLTAVGNGNAMTELRKLDGEVTRGRLRPADWPLIRGVDRVLPIHHVKNAMRSVILFDPLEGVNLKSHYCVSDRDRS